MIKHKNSICKNMGSHKLHVRLMSIMQIVITYFYAYLDRKISDRISLQRHGFASDIKHKKYVIGRSSKLFVYKILSKKKKKKKKKKCFNFSAQFGVYSLMNSS